jgi:hypothetical protein
MEAEGVPTAENPPHVRWTWIAIGLFVVGAPVLAGLALLSPGLGSEGWFGIVTVGYALATLVLLILVARKRPWIWLVAAAQVVLLALVFYETFSGGSLYMGT